MSDQRSSAATVVLALEIVKVIVVKASDDLSRHIVWNVLSDFVKALLDSGDGRFLLGGRRPSASHEASPTSSRAGSPTPQGRSEGRPLSEFSDTSHSFAGSTTPRGSPGFQSRTSPSILDASMWSFFQLLVSFSSPLTLLLQPWIRTKVFQQLELAEAGGEGGRGRGGGSRSLSNSTATRTSLGGTRRLSSNFSRDTKHEGLLFVEGGGSLEASAGGGRSRNSSFSWTAKLDDLSSRHSISRLSLDGKFARSSFVDQHPQIRHLPLPSPPVPPSSSTPSANLLSHASAAKGLVVSSPIIVDFTVRAIRAVEAAFGVRSEEEGGQDDAEERSKTDALGRIVEESKVWIFGGEFADVF